MVKIKVWVHGEVRLKLKVDEKMNEQIDECVYRYLIKPNYLRRGINIFSLQSQCVMWWMCQTNRHLPEGYTCNIYVCISVCVMRVSITYVKFYIYVLCGFKTFKRFYVCLKCFSTGSISLECTHLGNFRDTCLYVRPFAVYRLCESS